MLKSLFKPHFVPKRIDELDSILPKHKTISRILFDLDSRLPRGKIIPILQSIHKNLESPQLIVLPSYANSDDLMICRKMLQLIRAQKHVIDPRLVALESELVEQAAELGNSDAIAILAFKTISGRVFRDSNCALVTNADYEHAITLIKDLKKINHPLTFKLAGDLAFKKELYAQLNQFWLHFIEVEPDSPVSSQVYASLGQYYFSYKTPRPDLAKAMFYFKKSLGTSNNYRGSMNAHYYLGQLYAISDPQVAKYHLQSCASNGLKESFASLGFLEMNMFGIFSTALEWFKLGFEATGDFNCLVGQFDCYVRTREYKLACTILEKIKHLRSQIISLAPNSPSMLPEAVKSMTSTTALIDLFFSTRQKTIQNLPQLLA